MRCSRGPCRYGRLWVSLFCFLWASRCVASECTSILSLSLPPLPLSSLTPVLYKRKTRTSRFAMPPQWPPFFPLDVLDGRCDRVIYHLRGSEAAAPFGGIVLSSFCVCALFVRPGEFFSWTTTFLVAIMLLRAPRAPRFDSGLYTRCGLATDLWSGSCLAVEERWDLEWQMLHRTEGEVPRLSIAGSCVAWLVRVHVLRLITRRCIAARRKTSRARR